MEPQPVGGPVSGAGAPPYELLVGLEPFFYPETLPVRSAWLHESQGAALSDQHGAGNRELWAPHLGRAEAGVAS